MFFNNVSLNKSLFTFVSVIQKGNILIVNVVKIGAIAKVNINILNFPSYSIVTNYNYNFFYFLSIFSVIGTLNILISESISI